MVDIDADVLTLITQVLSRYSHIIDDGSWDSLHMIFTSDAVIDHTPIGSALSRGLDEAASNFSTGMRRRPIAHHLTNSVVQAVDADGAVLVRTKWLVLERTGTGHSGYYLDRFVLTDKGWRISNRVATPRFKAK